MRGVREQTLLRDVEEPDAPAQSLVTMRRLRVIKRDLHISICSRSEDRLVSRSSGYQVGLADFWSCGLAVLRSCGLQMRCLAHAEVHSSTKAPPT